MFALPDGSYFAVARPRAMGDTSRSIGFLVGRTRRSDCRVAECRRRVDGPGENDRHRYAHFHAPDGKLYELVEVR